MYNFVSNSRFLFKIINEHVALKKGKALCYLAYPYICCIRTKKVYVPDDKLELL
jgi:hypothetical protein